MLSNRWAKSSHTRTRSQGFQKPQDQKVLTTCYCHIRAWFWSELPGAGVWSLEWSTYYPDTCIQLLTILWLWMMKLCATQKYLVFFLCYGLRMARNAINGAIRPRALGWPNRIPGISGSSSIQLIRGTGPGLLGPQISIKNSTDLRVASVGCNSRRMFANAK